MLLPVMRSNLHTIMSSLGRRSESSTRSRSAKNVVEPVACLHAHGFVHRGSWLLQLALPQSKIKLLGGVEEAVRLTALNF